MLHRRLLVSRTLGVGVLGVGEVPHPHPRRGRVHGGLRGGERLHRHGEAHEGRAAPRGPRPGGHLRVPQGRTTQQAAPLGRGRTATRRATRRRSRSGRGCGWSGVVGGGSLAMCRGRVAGLQLRGAASRGGDERGAPLRAEGRGEDRRASGLRRVRGPGGGGGLAGALPRAGLPHPQDQVREWQAAARMAQGGGRQPDRELRGLALERAADGGVVPDILDGAARGGRRSTTSCGGEPRASTCRTSEWANTSRSSRW